MMSYWMFLSLFISLSLMMMYYIIGMKYSFIYQEKVSPFECGFLPFFSVRIPFSLRFFVVILIFLIFDVEIALLFPLPLVNLMNYYQLISIIFIMFLVSYGLVHEWFFGQLDWI